MVALLFLNPSNLLGRMDQKYDFAEPALGIVFNKWIFNEDYIHSRKVLNKD